MNKKILGAGAASAVLAAMPLVATFAADTTTVTDTVTLTVSPSCTLGASVAGETATATLANGGTKKDLAGSVFSVSCNKEDGWHITAVGAGNEGHLTDLASADKYISTNTTLDGTASGWAFKATGEGVESTYQDFAAVPGTAQTIAKGSAPVSENEISITYAVSVGPEQAAGTYTGKVTYTLAQGEE